MLRELGSLYASVLPLSLLLLPFVVFMFVIGYPFLAWRAVRQVTQIREELTQLNETLGSKMTITKSGPLGRL